ncbi:MAG: hypothetical protein ACYC2Y_02040 [Armatimonadota bacterium]
MNSPYLRSHPTLLVLSMLPALLAALAMAASYHPWVYKRIARWRIPLMICTYLVTRFVLFYIIFIALGDRQIGNDVACWQRFGLDALHGKFLDSSSPLFAYLLAPAYALWNHTGSGVLVFILFDLATLFLLCKLTSMSMGRSFVLDVAWLYVLNPIVWVATVRYGQDETVTSAFLLFAIYLYMRDSRWWGPIIMALGVLSSKFTTGFGMAVIYTYSKSKIKDALVGVAVLLAVYVPFYMLGSNPMGTIRRQGGGIEGLSLTSLIDRLITHGGHYGLVHHAGSLLSLLAVAVVCYISHRRKLSILDTLTACLLAFLLFSPRSFKFYRLWFIGPLGMHAIRTNRINRYALYCGLLSTFDDFSFEPNSPQKLVWAMGALGALIILLEVQYLAGLLQGKQRNVVEATYAEEPVPAAAV